MSLLNLIRNRVTGVVYVVRFKSFDTSTVEGRSKERFRRAFWTAISATLAKGINTIAIYISVPITLSYLGTERFGLWMTISSFVAFLGFADLGVGNAILNLTAKANGNNDRASLQKNVSSAFFMLIVVSLGLVILLKLLNPFIDWASFFNVSSPLAKQEASPAVAIFVACFAVNLPLSIIPRVQSGFQEGYISGIWQGFSNMLGLVLLVAVVYLEAGLPWLVLLITGSSILGNIFNSISLFAFQRPWLIPKWNFADFGIAKKILGTGFLFLIIQMMNAIIYSADNIIITKVLGPDAVTNYAVPARLFLLIPNIFYMFLAPLWPAYGEAYTRGENAWAIKTLKKTVLITVAFGFLSTFLIIIFGKEILMLWTGSRVEYVLDLMIGLGAWTTLFMVITALSLFLNAINKIGFQVVIVTLTALLSVVVKITLAPCMGLPGIVWGQCAVAFVCMLIPYTIYLKMQFSKPSDLSRIQI